MKEHNTLNSNRLKHWMHSLLALTLVLHCAFFLVYWFSVGGFRIEVDQFIVEKTNLQFPYTTLLMGLATLLGLWSLVRFFRLRLGRGKESRTPNLNHWLYPVISLVFLVIFYGAFGLILRQDPSQKGILIHLLNLIRVIGDALLFLMAGIWLRQLILYLRRRMNRSEKKWGWTLAIILVLASVILLWVIPPLFPPNWTYRGELPTKPALIAHRGASMLAPENTLAAGELAAVMQALGFESDLRISLDGVPFLMHDETLVRTTNIAEVFPERMDEPASNFTLAELKELNAGLWFIQKDPYGTIKDGLVSQNQLSINQGQKIPTLQEALNLVEKNKMVFMFDLRYPPKDHPFYAETFEIVLTQCDKSGLNGDIWFLVSPENIEQVLEHAPQLTRVAGVSSTDLPSSTALLDQQYEIVNVDVGIRTSEIQEYRQKNLGVNVYTIDEPWLFSQFWLAGVTSVTTNNVHTLSQLNAPILAIPYSRFLLIWGIYGIAIAIWLASSQPEKDVEKKPQGVPSHLEDFTMKSEDNQRHFQPQLDEKKENLQETDKPEQVIEEQIPPESPDASVIDQE